MSKQTDLINVTDAITVSGSNVGIGTGNPLANLDVRTSSETTVKIMDTSASAAGPVLMLGTTDTSRDAGNKIGTIQFYSADGSSPGAGTRCEIKAIAEDAYNRNALVFSTGTYGSAATEAARIDSSGNLLVGKTTANNTDAGVTIYGSSASMSIARSGASQLILNRLSNDGDMAVFRKDGNTVGSIGSRTASSNLFINTGSSGRLATGGVEVFGWNSSRKFFPAQDNNSDLGVTNLRWDDIYATNGSIQTSDANEKQDVAALTATEMLVAARISAMFKTFRWIDSVTAKGDNARTHTGVIAQDVQAAFTAEGLEAGDYALFTSNTWWETQTDVPAVEADEDNDIEASDAYTRTDTYDTLAEAPAGATERTRMGIRYPELLAFVGAYNEQRFASIETRLAALEAV